MEEAAFLLSNVFEDGVEGFDGIGSIESEPCVFIETQESGVAVNIFSNETLLSEFSAMTMKVFQEVFQVHVQYIH